MQSVKHQGVNMNGDRLEMVREKLDINKSELARRIGSPQSHISKVLSGKESIGKHLSDQIVRQLHLNKQWWETGNGEIFTNGDSISHSFNKQVSIKGKRNNGTIEGVSSASEPTGNTGSIADELIKLAKLKEAGLISEEEFQLAKKIVLS